MLVTLYKYRKALGLGLLFLVGLGVGIHVHKRFSAPVEVVRVVKDTKQIIVNRPVLTERVVKQVIKDPKQVELINRLIAENNELNIKVKELTSTVAKNTYTGGSGPDVPTPLQGHITTQPTVYTYDDWQLLATYSADSFGYVLTQDFNIVTTSGRDAQGNKVSLVRLYQDTPIGPVLIPSKTTALFADESIAKWRFSPRAQLGIGFNSKKEKGAVVALQWLKHGKSTSAEDNTWALLSPALFANDNAYTLVLMPASFNVGSIKHNVLKDVWVSPFVTRNGKFWVVVTTTF